RNRASELYTSSSGQQCASQLPGPHQAQPIRHSSVLLGRDLNPLGNWSSARSTNPAGLPKGEDPKDSLTLGLIKPFWLICLLLWITALFVAAARSGAGASG